MSTITQHIQTQWAAVAPLFAIGNEREYTRAVRRMNQLLDEIGTNQKHPLYSLLDTLSTLVHAYEQEHHPMPNCSGAEALRFLMEEHGLMQSELPEIGSQGVVSEILSGKRELNTRQIRMLAKRFSVSPAVFI